MAVELKTFSDIYGWVLRMVKLPTTDTEALNAVKGAINSRYQSIAFRKKWRWRKAQRDLLIRAKRTTGTVLVTDNSREVTFSSAISSYHKGWWLNVTGTDENYKIIAVNTVTNKALLASIYIGATNALASYTLYQYQYGLFPDCEEIDFVWHDYMTDPVQIVSARKIRELVSSNPSCESHPYACSIEGWGIYEPPNLGEFVLGYDFLESNAEDDLSLCIFPQIPDRDYILHIDYCRRVNPLDEDTDKPLIPIEKRHVLAYGALADIWARERNESAMGIWEDKYNTELREMEADAEYTDEKPKLIVAGKWWGRRQRGLDASTADLGKFFDKDYDR